MEVSAIQAIVGAAKLSLTSVSCCLGVFLRSPLGAVSPVAGVAIRFVLVFCVLVSSRLFVPVSDCIIADCIYNVNRQYGPISIYKYILICWLAATCMPVDLLCVAWCGKLKIGYTLQN